MNYQSNAASLPAIFALVLVCAVVGAVTSVSPIAGAVAPIAIITLFALTRVRRAWLLLFVGFLVIQDPLRFLFGGDATPAGFVVKRLDEALLYLLAGVTLIASRDAVRALTVRRIGVLILGCLAGMVVSTLLIGTYWQPAIMDLVLFSKPFLLFTLGAGIRFEPEEIRGAIKVAVPLMLVVVVFAAVFLLAPSLQEAYSGAMRTPDQRLGMLSAQGFFDGPAPYSWFCAVTFALGYAAFLAYGRTTYLYTSMIAATFAVLSWRRKSIGAIVAMVLIATLIRVGDNRRGRRRAVAVLALSCLIGATILAPIISSLWSYTVHEYGGDRNSVARLALHYAALQIAHDRFPFGTGLASFGSHASAVYYSSVYQEYGLSNIWGLSPDYPAFITDTFWPMVLGQGGVVSLVPYLLFFWLLLRTFWRAARSRTDAREDHFLSLFALFVIVGSLVESTSSHIYDSTMQSAFVMIPAGLVWARLNSRANPAMTGDQPDTGLPTTSSFARWRGSDARLAHTELPRAREASD